MSKIKGRILTESGKLIYGEIEYESGVIKNIFELSESILSDSEKDTLILPGLVDIHSHGCGGFDTCDASVEGLLRMAEYEASLGITSYFPTTMTLPTHQLYKIMEALKEAASKSSVIKGVYLEGPFISAKKCGAQAPEYILAPDSKLLEKLNEASGGLIKFVAVAPETEGAIDFIRANSDKYQLSIAHTDADYDTSSLAIEAGAVQFTHLYNGMNSYNHREPGVIGAAMDSDDTYVELITDGIHVAPAVVRNTFRYFGTDRIVLISDSMEATGIPSGEYELGGQKVCVKNRKATLSDGTIAGSASNLFECVKSAVNMGIRLEDAVLSASATPAKRAGIFSSVGSLRAGKDADILICDSKLNLKKVITHKSNN